jgi:subtilisin family serine protease
LPLRSCSLLVATSSMMMPHLLDVYVSPISVLGTVGGTKYGIAKNVNLIAVKVLDSTGSGSFSWVIAGINWVVANADPNRRAVINLSLGGGAYTPVNDAVNNAVAAGVIVAVSAGNGNEDACGRSPASAASAITVGATGTNDARASFSNFGTCLDIFAPGVSIRSCSTLTPDASTLKNGASMASPHVAGVAALLLDEDPALTPALLLDRMLADATSGIVTNLPVNETTPNEFLYTGDINSRATASSAPSSTPSLAPSSAPTPVPAPFSTPSVAPSSTSSMAPSSAPSQSLAPSSAPSLDPTTAPTPYCGAKFASCDIDSDCCDNKCSGGGNNKKCT